MMTENYIVNLFGIDSKYYTNEYVAYVWEKNANEEYENNGIFVSAMIDINRLVCGEIRECNLGETVHRITTTRNPAEVLSKEAFYESFINVVNNVRMNLEYPDMTISIGEVEFFYFTRPSQSQ